jgi:WhiB family redox-sensing transcriptional regulator
MEDKKFNEAKYNTVVGTEWMIDGNCLETDPEIFFPEQYKIDGEYVSQVKEAKAICAECPVKLKCRTYILEIESKPNVAGRYGIWGGTTPEERKAIVARQKLASTV